MLWINIATKEEPQEGSPEHPDMTRSGWFTHQHGPRTNQVTLDSNVMPRKNSKVLMGDNMFN